MKLRRLVIACVVLDAISGVAALAPSSAMADKAASSVPSCETTQSSLQTSGQSGSEDAGDQERGEAKQQLRISGKGLTASAEANAIGRNASVKVGVSLRKARDSRVSCHVTSRSSASSR